MNRRDLLKTVGMTGAGGLLGSHHSLFAQQGSAAATAPGLSSHDLFENYDRRFAEAKLRRPHRDPAKPADRQAIIAATKKVSWNPRRVCAPNQSRGRTRRTPSTAAGSNF